MKSLMSILKEIPLDDVDIHTTFIRCDDVNKRLTYKLRINDLINIIKKEISKKKK